MVGAALTTKYVFDAQPDDVYWCTADCGWITGHSYVTYGRFTLPSHVSVIWMQHSCIEMSTVQPQATPLHINALSVSLNVCLKHVRRQ